MNKEIESIILYVAVGVMSLTTIWNSWRLVQLEKSCNQCCQIKAAK